jgi:hypothetical protein
VRLGCCACELLVPCDERSSAGECLCQRTWQYVMACTTQQETPLLSSRPSVGQGIGVAWLEILGSGVDVPRHWRPAAMYVPLLAVLLIVSRLQDCGRRTLWQFVGGSVSSGRLATSMPICSCTVLQQHAGPQGCSHGTLQSLSVSHRQVAAHARCCQPLVARHLAEQGMALLRCC